MCNICNNELGEQSVFHKPTKEEYIASYNYYKLAYEKTGDPAFQRHYLKAEEVLKTMGINV